MIKWILCKRCQLDVLWPAGLPVCGQAFSGEVAFGLNAVPSFVEPRSGPAPPRARVDRRGYIIIQKHKFYL